MRNTHDILIISIGKEGEDGGFHKLKSWQQASEPYSGSDEEEEYGPAPVLAPPLYYKKILLESRQLVRPEAIHGLLIALPQ
jgi:hypothetical protein